MSNAIKLPKNTYIVIDPCYVMTEENYDLLLEEYTGNNGPEALEVMVNGRLMALSSTAYGDGTYSSSLPDKSFAVDAGIIGAVPLSLCCPEKLAEEWVNDNSVMIHDSEIYFSYDSGTFVIHSNDGHLEIYTGPDEEGEDEDYYF